MYIVGISHSFSTQILRFAQSSRSGTLCLTIKNVSKVRQSVMHRVHDLLENFFDSLLRPRLSPGLN